MVGKNTVSFPSIQPVKEWRKSHWQCPGECNAFRVLLENLLTWLACGYREVRG